MRTRFSLPPALLALLLLLLAPAEASADHVVITGGSLSHGNPITQAFPGYSFEFSGAGLYARGVDEKLGTGGHLGCVACAPGTTVGGTFVIDRFSGGSAGASAATVGGTGYGPVWFNGSRFTFNLAPVTLPSVQLDSITLTTNFTFDGRLVGDQVPLDGQPEFDLTLSGQGIATLTFVFGNFGGQMGYVLTNVRYDFAPAQVPEPATLLLLGAGLAGAAGWRRRRGN